MDVTFFNDINKKLSGRIEFPDNCEPPYPVVVFSHGFDSGKDSSRGVIVAEEVRKQGIATFLFDFTGHGDSQGTKYESTLERQISDLKSALLFVSSISQINADRIGVTGASSGGLVAAHLALVDERIMVLVLRGPRTNNLSYEVSNLRIPVRIIQGELDPLLSATINFFNNLKCEKDLNIIPGADHLFSQPGLIKLVAISTADWFAEKFKCQRKAA